MDFFVENFQIFLLIFVRIFGMCVSAPLFSSGTIPFRVRAAVSVFMTVAVFPIVVNTIGTVPENMYSYALMIISEAVTGILIGFLVSIIFSAFQLAARLFSFQMALGIAEVIDPFSQVGITIVGQLWTLFGLLIFIAISGPHLLIMATVDSFARIRLIDIAGKSQVFIRVLTDTFGAMFVVALKLAFPVLITLFLLAITLGLLAKAAPQMNIFMVGFPLQIGVGFLIMLLVIGAVGAAMSNAITRIFEQLVTIIRAVGG